MPDFATFALFLSAAIALAIAPGPGIFYVMTRSLKGGWREGVSSAMGTSVGGLLHVIAAALGISVVLAASALAFSIVKYLGAAYLIYLGIKTVLKQESIIDVATDGSLGYRRAFVQGIVVEVLNPKTALFFIAFIPQFINPDGVVFAQFLLLGSLSILLNTVVDFMVILLAGPLGECLRNSVRFRKIQQYVTGTGLIALGSYVAFSGDRD